MRLIDAEEVANCYERMMKNLDEKNALPEQITEFAVAREYLQWASYVINNTPTVDAVEVVRCKDCKIAQNNRYNSRVDGKCSVLCEHVTTEDGRYELKVFRNANDFCSYGERKEE